MRAVEDAALRVPPAPGEEASRIAQFATFGVESTSRPLGRSSGRTGRGTHPGRAGARRGRRTGRRRTSPARRGAPWSRRRRRARPRRRPGPPRPPPGPARCRRPCSPVATSGRARYPLEQPTSRTRLPLAHEREELRVPAVRPLVERDVAGVVGRSRPARRCLRARGGGAASSGARGRTRRRRSGSRGRARSRARSRRRAPERPEALSRPLRADRDEPANARRTSTPPTSRPCSSLSPARGARAAGRARRSAPARTCARRRRAGSPARR